MNIGTLDGQALPAVIEPAGDTPRDRSVDALVDWLGAARSGPGGVDETLTRVGALLLRGFDTATPAAFERAARAISPSLKNDYLGTSPRDALTEFVFSASELPPFYPIPQHIEMSFTRHPPDHLFFVCLVEPSGIGGETPLVDFRAVARDLDSAVKSRFVERGVRNVRNYSGPSGGSRLDPWKLKRWDQMFRTTDRATVEKTCADNGFEPTWRGKDGLRLTNVQPAFKKHPVTGEDVWFNHAQVFHLSAVPAEYRRIARRQKTLPMHGLALLSRALVAAKSRIAALDDQAMHCTYGDGTPISDSDMDAVRDAIWKNLRAFSWRKGDVVAIDNRAVSHGRMPYRGPRQIAVCWA